ncbi:iron-sulfur cluster biosynthesis family protein [Salisediminibacterium selenitireducens]|uniref:Core domain-containing protein n=1 Tax=Bacillus selenitireducens (strain ATCC 700615 / DSM 15326 / MLS10) TaxID=439292 RepID=D6XW69_BACIE|nr:iron-sulfur cluster biosynthesis family protein [Salisediminibacterium selenitireducens]ADH99823.1 hypothetical protein Bsel_2320 [[Bacillus] selenitireducens MLS10]
MTNGVTGLYALDHEEDMEGLLEIEKAGTESSFFIESRFEWVLEDDMTIDFDQERHVYRLKSPNMMINPSLTVIKR